MKNKTAESTTTKTEDFFFIYHNGIKAKLIGRKKITFAIQEYGSMEHSIKKMTNFESTVEVYSQNNGFGPISMNAIFRSQFANKSIK